MDVLKKQNIEKQELSIFLRDLSTDVNTNLKHMIEDMVLDKNRKEEKGKKSSKKKIIINSRF